MIEGAPHEYKEETGACKECGNSPVNHFEHYLSNTLTHWSSGARKKSLRGRFFAWSHAALGKIEQPAMALVGKLLFASYSTDVQKANTYRSQVIWEEANRRGIEMQQMNLFGHGTEIYRARMRDHWTYFQSLPIPDARKNDVVDWIDDKYLLKKALLQAGIPAPKVFSVRSHTEAQSAFDMLSSAAVVKPRLGSRGRHTTVNVRSKDDAALAFVSAQKLGRHVVIEEYLEGAVCRGTVVEGILVGFFQAHQPVVYGDGLSTIEQLVALQNLNKHERVQDIVLNDEHHRYLGSYDLSLDTVVPNGARVVLSHRTGRLFGGRTRELLGSEHPKLREYLERAARLIGSPVVGFDLIIEDPEKDPDGQKWGIIEANSLPYIDLHYLPLEGAPSNVAAAVWDLWKNEYAQSNSAHLASAR